MPYTVFGPYLMENGFDLGIFFQSAFRDGIASFLSLDLLVVVFVSLVFIFIESRRLKIKFFWVPVVLIFFVSLSCGLPLFLYWRELALDKK